MERLESKGTSASWRDDAHGSPDKPQAKKAAEGNGVPREVENLTQELNQRGARYCGCARGWPAGRA